MQPLRVTEDQAEAVLAVVKKQHRKLIEEQAARTAGGKALFDEPRLEWEYLGGEPAIIWVDGPDKWTLGIATEELPEDIHVKRVQSSVLGIYPGIAPSRPTVTGRRRGMQVRVAVGSLKRGTRFRYEGEIYTAAGATDTFGTVTVSTEELDYPLEFNRTDWVDVV